MKIITLSFILFPLIFGCTNRAEKEKQELEEKEEKLNNELIKKSNAIVLNDSLNNHYSYNLNEIFVDQKKLLAFKGDISDVSMNDSSFVINASSDFDNHKYLTQVIVDKNSIEKLKQVLKYDSYEKQKALLIIKVLRIVTKNPSLELNKDSEDDPYISFGDLDTNIIVFKGELIDFNIY
jgi:hypothetical protein